MNYNDEFYHHGIKGMKWGVRRYQKKNGSLTALGKKLRKAANKYRKEKKQKAEAKKAIEAPKKSVKDMSDAELRNRINRLNMEKQFMDLDRQVNGIKPAETSRGEKLVSTLKKELVPSLSNIGKNLISSYMEKKGKELLGLSSVDELDSLRKTASKLGLEKQIRDLKKDLDGANDDGLGDLRRKSSKLELDKKIRDLERDLSGGNKKTTSLDMTKLDQYSDAEIESASKRQSAINNLLRNWDNFSTTYVRDFYGNDSSYADAVSRGETEVQRWLEERPRRSK